MYVACCLQGLRVLTVLNAWEHPADLNWTLVLIAAQVRVHAHTHSHPQLPGARDSLTQALQPSLVLAHPTPEGAAAQC